MAVRQRTWTWKGRERTAWVVDYFDSKGKRRLRRCAPACRAGLGCGNAHRPEARNACRRRAESITIEAAGRLWLASCEANGLERSTREQYRQHVELHIVLLIINALKQWKPLVPLAGRCRGVGGWRSRTWCAHDRQFPWWWWSMSPTFPPLSASPRFVKPCTLTAVKRNRGLAKAGGFATKCGADPG